MILLIDNYDSFVHNLARYMERLGHKTQVVRNDDIDITSIREIVPQAIVLSPGPCSPNEAGICLQVVEELHAEIPMLGVCLGHQVIAAAMGAKVVRSTQPMHGRTSLISHYGSRLFTDIPESFRVCRYHSLTVVPDSLPQMLQLTAMAEDGTVMALQHRSLPVFGVQFHPEAILTEHGYQLLRNFLTLAGLSCEREVNELQGSEQHRYSAPDETLPTTPVTF